MSTIELIELIDKLPEDKKNQVEELVFKLMRIAPYQKSDTNKEIILVKNTQTMFEDLKRFAPYQTEVNEPVAPYGKGKSKRNFGGGKDIFGEIADDFNEPLDELKDYL